MLAQHRLGSRDPIRRMARAARTHAPTLMPSAAPIFRPSGTRPGADRQRLRADDQRRSETQPSRKWYKLALWQRRRAHQLASEPLCRMCADTGKVISATIADHVTPHRGDWSLFASGELQSLCKFHHDSTKRIEENTHFNASRPEWLKPSAVPLTIVTGPPAGGKNTYVDKHAAPGDLIVDLDMIAADLSGHDGHDWDRRWLGPALNERNRILGSLATRDPAEGAAWFIVGAPTPDERNWWSAKLRPGEIVVLETSIDVCMARIRQANTRNRDSADDAASKWWAGYQRRDGEIVIVTRA